LTACTGSGGERSYDDACFKHILFPVDFSQQSCGIAGEVAQVVREAAEEDQADLELTCVNKFLY